MLITFMYKHVIVMGMQTELFDIKSWLTADCKNEFLF